MAAATQIQNQTGIQAKTASRKDFSAPMRSFFGGLTLMLGVGFFGWGFIFLMRYPSHGEGRMAVILGVCAILIGIFLIFPLSRDSE